MFGHSAPRSYVMCARLRCAIVVLCTHTVYVLYSRARITCLGVDDCVGMIERMRTEYVSLRRASRPVDGVADLLHALAVGAVAAPSGVRRAGDADQTRADVGVYRARVRGDVSRVVATVGGGFHVGDV